MKFSSAPNTSVQQVPQPPISKTVPTLFQKNISNSRSGSTKWQISSQLPPQFFKINLRDTPSHIFILPLGFRPLFFRLLENAFISQKIIKRRHFYSWKVLLKTFLQVLTFSSQAEENDLCPQATFIRELVSTQQKWGGL